MGAHMTDAGGGGGGHEKLRSEIYFFIQDKFSLYSKSKDILEVKISQTLATKLNISKTELVFSKPQFKINLPLDNSKSQGLEIPVKVLEIMKASFVDDSIYYNYENMMNFLDNHSFSENFSQKIEKWKNTKNIANAYYTTAPIPNIMLNLTLPISKNEGLTITDYVGDEQTQIHNLDIVDFDILSKTFKETTWSYTKLVNRVVYIFIAITIIVSLLLTYLFLVENRQKILLFKSLGYSVRDISNFLIGGYAIAAVIGVGIAVGASVLAVSLLSTAFISLFGIPIPFTFTTFYSILIVVLPIAFVVLILFSLWVYIFIQDPKKALSSA